jgi:hypothetical protein
MDDIVIHLRGDNEPAAEEPVGGELSVEQYDASLSNLKTGIEQAYAESFKYTDAAELDEESFVLVPEDRFFFLNSAFDEEEPVGTGNQPYLTITWADILAAVLGEIPDGPGTAAEIRDALETLTGADRLDASAIQNLPPNILTIGSSLTELVGSDLVVVIRDGVPYHATLAAVQTFTGGAPSDTAPAAFEAGDWTATAIAGGISVDIDALPDDGGSAITALQYRIDGGSPVAFTGTGTGVRNITGLTGGVEVDVEIRAVNAIGSGAWSDVKARTPDAAPSALSIVQDPDPSWVSGDDEFQQTVTAITVGNGVLLQVVSGTAAGVPAISDSEGGDDDDWGVALDTYDGANGQTVRWYARANIASELTWVRAAFAGNTDGYIAAAEVAGGGAAISLDDSNGDAEGTSTEWELPFTSTVDDVVMMANGHLTNGSLPIDVAPLDALGLAGNYNFYARGVFPTAGAQIGQVDLTDGRNGDKAWAVFKAGA